MNNTTDILSSIYFACKDIPGWLDKLRPFHPPEDIKYFEKLIKMDKGGIGNE